MKIRYVAIFLILVIPALISDSIAQEVAKSKPVFGVRLSANFDNIFFSSYDPNSWVLRTLPGFFLEYKNHDFQIGPAHAHFINNPGWLTSTLFNSNSLGLNFGYRYYPIEIMRRMRMYAQLQASRFLVKSTNFSQGSGLSDYQETDWFGYASLGVDYRTSKRFHVFSGIGIGISSTFYKYTENFYPHVLAGIDYRFGTPKKVPESRAQKIIKSKPVFGVRYTANYASIPTGQSYSKNFRVLSSAPSVFVEFNKRFDFHIGMVYAHLLNPHWFEYSSFEQDAFGFSLGCRLTARDNNRNLRLIGQVDLSATKVGFKQTNSHSQDFMVKKILWVPGLSMGGDYLLINNFHMTAGCSAGLAIGEYYDLNKIILSLFLGVDYRFRSYKKK